MSKAIKKKVPATTKNDSVPAFLQESMGDLRGSEHVENSDITIPRIEIVQSLSKVRKKNEAAYIPGIEEGMLYNNVTREVYGDELEVIPVYYTKEWLLWRDADAGGGFGGGYPTREEAEAGKAGLEKPEEYENVETSQQFVLVVKPDGLEEAVLSMAKSKSRVSRDWNALIRMGGGPRFSRRYLVAGVASQNNNGQDYFNLRVSANGFVDENQFDYAENVYNLITKGAVGVDRGVDGQSTDSEM